MDMQKLLKATIQFNASDLHVQVGSPPTVRVDGTMVAINAPPVTAENLRELVAQVATGHTDQRDPHRGFGLRVRHRAQPTSTPPRRSRPAASDEGSSSTMSMMVGRLNRASCWVHRAITSSG